MEKLYKLVKKPEFYLPLILVCYLIIYYIFTWGMYGSFYNDSYREILIPEAIMQGKLLYKDILNLYPPFGYYISCFVYMIFGTSLNVVYGLCAFCIVLCLISYYKLMQLISSYKTAFISTFLIMSLLICKIGQNYTFGWEFPYSFSFLYAYTFANWAVYFFFLYKYKSIDKYFYISAFLSGLSVACKWDFAALILIFIYELFKRKSLKFSVRFSMLFVIPIIFSYIIFFVNGGNFDILKDWCYFLYRFNQNDAVKEFNKLVLPQAITWKIITDIFRALCLVSMNLILLAFCVYMYFILNKNFKTIFAKIIILGMIFGVYYTFMSVYWMNPTIYTLGNHEDPIFLPFLMYIILFTILVKKLYKFFVKKEKIKPTVEETTLVLCICTATLLSFRAFCGLYFSNMGNFTLSYFLIATIYLIYNVLIKYVKDKKSYINLVSTAFIVFALSYNYYYFHVYKTMNHPIKTDKGTIKVHYSDYYALKYALDFGKENIKDKGKTLLVVEEALYVHYLLDIPIIDYELYSLHSHMVPLIGEKKIINKLDNYKPDYIYKFLPPLWCRDPKGGFGVSYAQEFYKWILENYDIVATVRENDDYYGLTIFERKGID